MENKTYLIVVVIVFCCVAVENVTSISARSVPELRPDLHRRYRRIVNGDVATPHDWPWMVYLDCTRCKYFCGGSLIHRQWVLTAAHCAKDVSINTDKVYLGAHNVKIQEASQQRVGIAATRIHPQYDPNTEDYDVALLKLRTPATINNFVSLATLIAKNQGIAAGKRCTVTGWGSIKNGGPTSDVLRQAEVPILSRQKCLTFWQDMGPEGLCAGGDGKGICHGDSGGPLNCYHNRRWRQVGIVSYTDQCKPRIPDGYVNVAKVRDFIDGTINPPLEVEDVTTNDTGTSV